MGKVNRLDGLTILRFAHSYEAGGGVELYLHDLNRGLSFRNKFTTILVHLTKDKESSGERTESIGQSQLVKIALPAVEGVNHNVPSKKSKWVDLLRSWLGCIMNVALFSFAVNRLFVQIFLRGRRVPVRSNDAPTAGPIVAELIKRYQVDLVVLHTDGGADASEIIRRARGAGVPIAIVHHFANQRLGNVSVRQQLAEVPAVAGGSTIGLPFYVRSRFTNLADTVDLELFRVEDAMPVPVAFSAPVLFAPGRLTPDKGQMDALQVALALHQIGIKNNLVFAGRIDDPAFAHALLEKAKETEISDFVCFAGELTQSKFRDWLKASYLMLMPTRHHEGLPRTLIESQAMMVPPIVYNIGGIPDGVQHGQTGFLVPLGDISAMTEYAATLLRDQVLRQQMAENGRNFVKSQFSMEAFLTRHENFYLETLSGHRL